MKLFRLVGDRRLLALGRDPSYKGPEAWTPAPRSGSVSGWSAVVSSTVAARRTTLNDSPATLVSRLLEHVEDSYVVATARGVAG
jgi:hypothetical protein